MLFQMNSKWFRYASYDIIDQKGDVAYKVGGKLWSLGDNLKILKPDGAEVGSIRTSFLFNPFEKYQIQLNKKVQDSIETAGGIGPSKDCATNSIFQVPRTIRS